MNIPNAISLARLCAVPIIMWLILTDEMRLAFWLTLFAAVSDALDGIIAKSFDQVTVLGSYLDPIADKALLVCSYIALGHEEILPIWFVILVVFRDLVIIGGALSYHVMTLSLQMSPIMLSKVNTFAQLALLILILADEGLNLNSALVRDVFIYVVGITTVLSGAVYVVVWGRKASSIEQNKL